MSEEEKIPIDIYDFVTVMADQSVEIAWIKLGLRPDPMTGDFLKDVAQAKVAIDLLAHLSGLMEPRLDENDKRELQNMVSTLRLNYVQKVNEGG